MGPWLEVDQGSVSAEDLVAVGVSYRQLDVWTNQGLLLAVNQGCGSGRRRWWPAGEVEVARVMGVLVEVGLSPVAAAKAARGGGVLGPGVRVVINKDGIELGSV